MVESKEKQIIDFVIENPQCSSKDILDGISISTSYATIKRILSKLTNDNLLIINGKGKGSKYSISPLYKLIQPIDVEQYYKQEIDERSIIDSFNINLIREILNEVDVFTTDELKKLSALQDKYTNNISQLTELEYKKELERLAIDLSWKSSQIEGTRSRQGQGSQRGHARPPDAESRPCRRHGAGRQGGGGPARSGW